MYEKLKYALYKRPMTMKAYAEFLGITEKTLENKMSGKSRFTWDEVEKTCTFLFPDMKIEHLFMRSEKQEAS